MTENLKTEIVLIIEDEVEVLHFASRVLELEGYQVLQANDTDEGMRLARGCLVALVLLDLRLPGRDGWVILEQMRSDPKLSKIPVIVFTASAGVSQRERALGMGAADYLVKPLSSARLRKAVARVLHQEG